MPSRPLLPHCQLSPFFFPLDAGSPHLHTPSSFVGSLVEEELLSSTTTTTTVFLRLCSPRGWINCCVFDIHSLSGPGRRRRDERIKRKVTERLVLVPPPLSPKLLLDSTCTADKNIIPPSRCSFLSFSPKKSISRKTKECFSAFPRPSGGGKKRFEDVSSARNLLISFNRCHIFNAPIDPEERDERWNEIHREIFPFDVHTKFFKIHTWFE